MKRVLIVLFLFFSISSFADAGYGYRFSIKAILQNNDTISGYIYVYSWEKYEGFGNLESFLNKNVPNHNLSIYPHVVTTTTNLITLDFALSDSEYNIKLKDIVKINEFDIVNFGGGTFRLKELSEAEFKLIKIGKPYSNAYNIYDLTEYCHLLVLDWKVPIDKDLVKDLYKKLKAKKLELGNNLEGDRGNLFYDYFNQLKQELIDKGVLMIMYCESC